jgi:cytochrome c biogenesis protein CcmG/thiol:disulfide interchange protein DsbE
MRNLCFILLLVLGLSGPGLARSPEAGQAAPDFALRTLDGREIHAAGLEGKVVLVHFWATWCPPCREEMPALERFYRRHRRDGLEILAISIEDVADLARVRAAAAAYSFPVALAPDAEVAGFGRVWVVPLSFVIDRHGLMRVSGWTGERGIDDASLAAALSPLLDERER